MERRRTVQTGSWTPSPPAEEDPTEWLSDADRLRLISEHQGLKPSSLPGAGKDPLLVLSPEELAERVASQELAEGDDETPLWEELANDVLWTIPFGFLYTAMLVAVFKQFGQEVKAGNVAYRLLNVVPTLFFLTFLVSRPKPIVHPYLLQVFLLGICIASGISLVHITTTESYLKVMAQAPGIGTIWVWSVVRLDLGPAVLGLLGVAAGAWYRGELGAAKWW